MALTDSLARQESWGSTPASSAAPESLSSQVMPQILADLEGAAPLRVLDVGYGMAETVAFFSEMERHCRLHFIGLQELLEREASLPEEERGEETWYRLFEEVLGGQGDERFDLILFWDFFNYLDEPAVRAFNRALTPYVDRQSRGHGFLAPNTNTAVPGRRYSLAAEDRIVMRPAAPLGPDIWQRPHGRLNSLLEAMAIGHSVLRHGGLLEFSIKGIR
ncbi:MAG: class I SAM-dependent methyltransferase [Pseudohongiellaceae bacterium]